MELNFIARSKDKGELDICNSIIRIETIKADERTIEDLQRVIETLKKLDYTIDG